MVLSCVGQTQLGSTVFWNCFIVVSPVQTRSNCPDDLLHYLTRIVLLFTYAHDWAFLCLDHWACQFVKVSVQVDQSWPTHLSFAQYNMDSLSFGFRPTILSRIFVSDQPCGNHVYLTLSINQSTGSLKLWLVLINHVSFYAFILHFASLSEILLRLSSLFSI